MFKTTQPYLWGILLIRNYTVDLLIPSLINSKIPWCFLTLYIIYYKTVIFENVVYNHNLSDKFLKDEFDVFAYSVAHAVYSVFIIIMIFIVQYLPL